jgi:hypothetical protein
MKSKPVTAMIATNKHDLLIDIISSSENSF